MTAPLIDLDAAKREGKYPDGIPVRLGGVDYTLPGELPAEIIDPFLSDDLDLVGLIRDLIDERDQADEKDDFAEKFIDALIARPQLPVQFVDAIKAAFRALFDATRDGQYAEFVATGKPSIPDYLRLVKALIPYYGVGLGEAFASAGSSESGGQTSKPTSPFTQVSTPDAPGTQLAATGS